MFILTPAINGVVGTILWSLLLKTFEMVFAVIENNTFMTRFLDSYAVWAILSSQVLILTLGVSLQFQQCSFEFHFLQRASQTENASNE